SIGTLHLEILREALAELDEASVIDGIATAIKQTDPPEIGIRAGVRMLVDRHWSSVGIGCCNRQRRKQIDVPCARQMLTANAQVAESHGVIVSKLPLQVKAPLMRQ